MEFQYLATDAFGTRKEGTLRAHSLEDARNAVEAMELTPVEIYERNSGRIADLQTVPLYSELRDIQDREHPPGIPADKSSRVYLPLLDTLRLYAGWLLAWYCLVYAVGFYQSQKSLPFSIPFTESLFLSPLVLSFTFAAYLFLLLSGFYLALGKRTLHAFVLLILGIAIFLLYRINVT